MKFWEAMRELEAGRKVRITDWIDGDFIHLIKGELVDERGGGCKIFDVESCINDKWVIWESDTGGETDRQLMEAIKNV